MKKKVVPYNTGKVLIGVNYVPPKDKTLTEPSGDMARLQKAMLKNPNPQPTTAETWMMRVVLAFCAVVIVLDLFVWRP
jgi:hypothetical protein